MQHTPLIQQSTHHTNKGAWWAHCCRSIIDAPGDDGWRPTREAAEQLAAWHVAGEVGSPPAAGATPASPPVQLDLFPAA